MTAKDCILGRRSIRRFKPDAIHHNVLEEIVETASYAPSWKHTQITRYIAVEGALKDQIAAEACEAWKPNADIINLIGLTYLSLPYTFYKFFHIFFLLFSSTFWKDSPCIECCGFKTEICE